MISRFVTRIISIFEYLFWKGRGKMPLELNGSEIHISISKYLGDFREVKFFQNNEQSEMRDILSEATADDVFLDIGANIGIHSMFADTVVDTVYAIEPHPVNCSHFLINKNTNSSDVHIFACALSDSEGFIQMAGPRGGLLADGSVAFSEYDVPSKAGPSDGRENEIFVRTERGDTLLSNQDLDIPNIIKIDVEGAEEKVVEGLSSTLERPECRLVYCEVHEERADFDTVASKLESSGFSIDVIDERDYARVLKASK
jgi:FkbM family methyltransferase